VISGMVIRDLDQNEISYENFIKKIVELNKEGYSFHIGSDSQEFYKKISFVTTVCFHHSKKGAGAFYIKERVSRVSMPTLKSRIMSEAYRSLEAAFEVEKYIDSKISVHLDIGADPKKNKTHTFKKELVNLVTSQGYDALIKPNSWASSSVADWFTKT